MPRSAHKILRATRTAKGRRLLRLWFLWTAVAMFTGGCSLPEPIGQLSWDTHLVVPFGVRTYGLADLVHDSTELRSDGSGIGMDADSFLYYAAFTNLHISLGDSLAFEAMSDTLVKPPHVVDTTAIFAVENQRYRLFFARVREGTLTITVQNPQPDREAGVQVTLLNLETPLGEPTLIALTIPAQSQTDTTISLFNYRFILEDETPQTTAARLQSLDSVALIAIIATSRLTFSYCEVELDGLDLPEAQGGSAVAALPEGWDNVHPTTADAFVRVTEGVAGATADVILDLQTYLAGAPLASAHVVLDDLPLQTDSSAAIHDLAHLIEDYPDSASTNAQMSLSGRVSVSLPDTAALEVELRAPLSFTLEPVHSPGDVWRVQTDDLSEIQRGSARVRIWNRLPVGGRAYLVADADSLDVLPSSGADVDTVVNVQIPLPPLSSGRAACESYTELEIGLAQDVLDLFAHPPFFVRTDVALAGSGDDTLRAHAGDWLKVQVIADIIFRIDSGEPR